MFILNGRYGVINLKAKSIVEMEVQWIVVKVTQNFLNTLITLVFLIFVNCFQMITVFCVTYRKYKTCTCYFIINGKKNQKIKQ